MDIVEAYLRAQFAEVGQPSMESGVGSLFPKFDIPSIYTPFKLPIADWNRPELQHRFTDEALRSQAFRTTLPDIQWPSDGWLTLGGQQLGDQIHRALSLELGIYQDVYSQATESIDAYLSWAIETTAVLGQVCPDDLLASRPKTAAEALCKLRVQLLGMKTPKALTQSLPFHGDVLTTFKVPVRPDPNTYTKDFLLDGNKAIELIHWAHAFDDFGDTIDKQFVHLDRLIKPLKTFQEVLQAIGRSHELVRFLDTNMTYPYNLEILGALFYRTRAIADFLRRTVWVNYT